MDYMDYGLDGLYGIWFYMDYGLDGLYGLWIRWAIWIMDKMDYGFTTCNAPVGSLS